MNEVNLHSTFVSFGSKPSNVQVSFLVLHSGITPESIPEIKMLAIKPGSVVFKASAYLPYYLSVPDSANIFSNESDRTLF